SVQEPLAAERTHEGIKLLRIVKDTRLALRVRAAAARKLGQAKAGYAVRPLANELLTSASGDVLTLNIVSALGSIGDRRALPALRYTNDRNDIRLPGKIYAALHWAIRECEKKAPQGQKKKR